MYERKMMVCYGGKDAIPAAEEVFLSSPTLQLVLSVISAVNFVLFIGVINFLLSVQ